MSELSEPDVIIIRNGVFNCHVCSRLDEDKTLEMVRKINPSGTENNWLKIDYEQNPTFKPLKCERFPDRMHYVFEC